MPNATPRFLLFSYVLPAFSLAALAMPVAVYLPNFYASNHFGIAFWLVGAIFAGIRILDVFIDPLAGYISDRWRTRFGRRRPLIMLGTPLLVLGIWMVFAPGGPVGAVYLGFWLFVMYVGNSAVLVPHLSWGAEISTEYHERSRIYGWLQMLTVCGMASVLLVPAVLSLKGFALSTQVAAMGLLSIVSLVLGVALCVTQVPESEVRLGTHAPLLPTLRFVLGNPAVRRLMLVDLLESTNQGARGAMFLYFASLVLGLPKYGGPFLVAYFLAGIVFTPAWIALSRRIGKHRALIASYAYQIATGPLLFLIPPGHVALAFALIALTGVSYSAPALLIRAMMADVVDADTQVSGAERSGLMYAFLSMTTKWGLGWAVFLAFGVLGLLGFNPKLANTAEAIANMRMFYILLPVGFAISTLTLMLGYSLDETRQRQLRADIDRRRAEGDILSGLVVARADPIPDSDAANDAIVFAKGAPP
jgi:Na+/melibiose symporter-like transporter